MLVPLSSGRKEFCDRLAVNLSAGASMHPVR
jgi:hypothetical protein